MTQENNDREVTYFVQEEPMNCIFCGSDDIRAGRSQQEDGLLEREVSCHRCERHWHERYFINEIVFPEKWDKELCVTL